MNLLTAWILSTLMSISPSDSYRAKFESPEAMKTRYSQIAKDMYEAIHESKPLFAGENAELQEAALLTSIGFFESGFTKSVDTGVLKGDEGRSWCLMQINLGGYNIPKGIGTEEMQKWNGKDLIKDRKKCFKVAIEYLRNSMKACSDYKGSDLLSGYTTGRCIKGETTAKNRWSFAGLLLKENPFPATGEVSEKLKETILKRTGRSSVRVALAKKALAKTEKDLPIKATELKAKKEEKGKEEIKTKLEIKPITAMPVKTQQEKTNLQTKSESNNKANLESKTNTGKANENKS